MAMSPTTSAAASLTLDGPLPLVPDLVHLVFSYLKATDSPSVLAKLARCSKSVYREVAPRLYGRLILDADNAHAVAYGLDARACWPSTIDIDTPPIPGPTGHERGEHPEDNGTSDAPDYLSMSPEMRKFHLLGEVQVIELKDYEGTYALNRILTTYQKNKLQMDDDDEPLVWLFNSLSVLILRSSAVAALAWLVQEADGRSLFVDDNEETSARMVVIREPLMARIDPRHVILESHVWSSSPHDSREAPDGIASILPPSATSLVLGELSAYWPLKTVDVRDLIGFEDLPSTSAGNVGALDFPVDRYVIRYATPARWASACHQVQTLLPKFDGRVVLAPQRTLKFAQQLIAYDAEAKFAIEEEMDLRAEAADEREQDAPIEPYEGYETEFEIHNDPELKGVNPDEWSRRLLSNEELAGRIKGKVRFFWEGED